jgi:hypothetical protein
MYFLGMSGGAIAGVIIGVMFIVAASVGTAFFYGKNKSSAPLGK